LRSSISAAQKSVTVLLVALLWLTALSHVAPEIALAAAPTTSLTIKKLASDGSTVLVEKTVDYRWLMDPSNIPVLGDGTTHYYHQGPVFIDHPDEATEARLRWNPEEDTNVETKDMGALMGTNLKDLCDLVGGMAEGDKLKIRASDGFSKTYAYKNVYRYSEREGPMVICWYKDGQYPDTGFKDGMRLVWFADDSVNPWKWHVFGNWDWHEAADEEYWYYFHSGKEKYPTTTGLSVQNVAEIIIYSSEPVPQEGAEPHAGSPPEAPSEPLPEGPSKDPPEKQQGITPPTGEKTTAPTPGEASPSAAEKTTPPAAGEASPPATTETTPPPPVEAMQPVPAQVDATHRAVPTAVAVVAGIVLLAGITVVLRANRRGRRDR